MDKIFYYIGRHRNPSFPNGLVKTESDVIVRSVSTGLLRRMLVVALIDDTYPFSAFSDLTCYLEETRIAVF